MPQVIGVKDGSVDSNFELVIGNNNSATKKKNFRLTYYVISDTLSTNEDDIKNTVGIPPLFYPYNGCLCNKVSTKEINRVIHPTTGVACGFWEVECEFTNDVKASDNQQPTSKRPIVSWTSETEDEVLEKDAITGEAIETDAKEPILITHPISLPVLEITRYEVAPFNPLVVLGYVNKTNATPFWGAPPNSALMKSIESKEEVVEQVIYAVTTYRIQFKIKPNTPTPYKARVLHHGFKYRTAPGAKPVVYIDKHGNPATVNLVNGTGLKKADDQPPDFKEFNRYTQVNFNALSLGPF